MKKSLFVLFLLLILFLLAGCCSTNNTTVANSETVSQLAVEEFLSFTKIPRPSYSTSKALEYLENFADLHNLKHYRDDYGNFWMDIPATSGYENYPKVILQSHMDMVCASDKGVEIDFENTAITAIENKEEKTITAIGTSLGADNGMGVGITLAIAESAIPHGPIRAIITTDEDVGLLGAEQLDASVIDSDYLINIDNETVGEIIYSSAGTLRFVMTKHYQTSKPDSSMKNFILCIDGLKGGHSGTDIGKNRLSAIVALSRILNKFYSEEIDVYISRMNAGDAMNAIARFATISFATDATKEQLEKLAAEVIAELKMVFPEENIEVSVSLDCSDNVSVISTIDSKEIVKVLSSFPQGVLKMSKTTEGLVQTSNNVGTVSVADGDINILGSSRSCVTADLEDLLSKFTTLSDDNGYVFEESNWYPGWDGNSNTPLLLLAEKAYDSIGINAEVNAIHAGLECSWFADKREGIQIICIGPTIENCHTPNETLYIDTIEPTVSAILYCLEHINI